MLFYFSGTGNSLWVAQQVAQSLSQTLVHMDDKARWALGAPQPKVGFVFPVYCYDTPEFVEDFLARLPIHPQTYYYAIVTCGGAPGNALYTVDRMLQQKGVGLSYGRVLTLPDNMAPLFEKPYDLGQIAQRKEELEVMCQEIGHSRIYRQGLEYDKATRIKTVQSREQIKTLLSPKTVAEDRCILCGACVSICPMENIQMLKRTIRIASRCVDCLACAHWCPQAAIDAGELHMTPQNRYHHPDIQMIDIIKTRLR